MKKFWVKPLAALVVLTFAITGCGVASSNSGVTGGSTPESAKVLKVGTDPTVMEKMGVDPKKYEAIPDAMNDLINGGLDAVVADSPVVLYFIKQNPNMDIEYVKGDFPKEYYGIAVKKGNSELQSKFNTALKNLQTSGKYNEIYKKWFNEDAPQL